MSHLFVMKHMTLLHILCLFAFWAISVLWVSRNLRILIFRDSNGSFQVFVILLMGIIGLYLPFETFLKVTIYLVTDYTVNIFG